MEGVLAVRKYSERLMDCAYVALFSQTIKALLMLVNRRRAKVLLALCRFH